MSLEVFVFMGTRDTSLPSSCANITSTVCCLVYFRVLKLYSLYVQRGSCEQSNEFQVSLKGEEFFLTKCCI